MREISIKNLMTNMSEWTCTDPDMLQYCRVIVPRQIYEYLQVLFSKEEDIEEAKYLLYSETVEVVNMTSQEKKYAIYGFYESIEQIKELYNEVTEQIIAECHFENNLQGQPFLDMNNVGDDDLFRIIRGKVESELDFGKKI